VNIRDERTVAEQVQSGFRLAGWLLLTLAFIYALLLCAGFLVGKGEYNQPIYRVAGACGLVALSVVMFMTVRRWVGNRDFPHPQASGAFMASAGTPGQNIW
jgi:hypothetical protein